MHPKPAHYVKVQELARRLGVDRRTIWRWAAAKQPVVEIRRFGPRQGVRARLLSDLRLK